MVFVVNLIKFIRVTALFIGNSNLLKTCLIPKLIPLVMILKMYIELKPFIYI